MVLSTAPPIDKTPGVVGIHWPSHQLVAEHGHWILSSSADGRRNTRDDPHRRSMDEGECGEKARGCCLYLGWAAGVSYDVECGVNVRSASR